MSTAEAAPQKFGGEYQPEPSIEAIILTKLGYGDFLDTPLEAGSTIIGRNFLDAYGNSPHRQQTEDMLSGFVDMPESDQDHEDSKALITSFIEIYFGKLEAD